MTPKMRILQPSVNVATLNDGRGGIFTYFPQVGSIQEWSYIVTQKGTDRGHHFHPEFDEYIMFVNGHGCYIEKDGEEEFVHLVGSGDCIYIPKGVNHTFKPLEDCKIIALITKVWDDCEKPIIRS